jgi:hypothetical protein
LSPKSNQSTSTPKASSKVAKKAVHRLPQDFASVAARLGCDPDMKKFDAKLKKIAKPTKTRDTR